MKNCTKCGYANWERTKTGRLHPSGEGICSYVVKMPVLPASRYWIGRSEPSPMGGLINRRSELKNDCPHYWEEK